MHKAEGESGQPSMNRNKSNWSAMGSCRSDNEIFQSIEDKAQEKADAEEKLRDCILEIELSAVYSSQEGMRDMLKKVLIEMLEKDYA